MLVGVPKEIKPNEFRVGLTPAAHRLPGPLAEGRRPGIPTGPRPLTRDRAKAAPRRQNLSPDRGVS